MPNFVSVVQPAAAIPPLLTYKTWSIELMKSCCLSTWRARNSARKNSNNQRDKASSVKANCERCHILNVAATSTLKGRLLKAREIARLVTIPSKIAQQTTAVGKAKRLLRCGATPTKSP